MELAAPLILSLSGAFLVGLVFYNRAEPTWQRNTRYVLAVAVAQVVLGALVRVLLNTQ